MLTSRPAVEEARRNEPDQIEAQKSGTEGLLGELFEGLDLALLKDTASEDERREFYATVASIFA